MQNNIFLRDTLFPKKINLKIYHTRVVGQFLTKYVQTSHYFVLSNPKFVMLKHINFINFQLRFSRKLSRE